MYLTQNHEKKINYLIVQKYKHKHLFVNNELDCEDASWLWHSILQFSITSFFLGSQQEDVRRNVIKIVVYCQIEMSYSRYTFFACP